MNPFVWNEKYESPVFILRIDGDFRSGTYFENERKLISSTVKKQIESNLLVVDLSAVIYWDTESMNYINELIKELNQKHARAGIVGPKGSYIYDRFFEKFGTDRTKLVWFETKDDFLRSLIKN